MAEITTTTSTDGIDRTYVITAIAPKDKSELKASKGAEFYYNLFFKNHPDFMVDGLPVEYDVLTTQQKLSIMGLEFERHWLEGAKAQYVKEAVDAAAVTAAAEVASDME